MEWPEDVVGGHEFTLWLGRTTRFHDAYVRGFAVAKDGAVTLTLRSFVMTPEVDARDQFVLDKHCLVTIVLEGVRSIDLDGFEEDDGVVDALTFSKTPSGFIRTTIDPVIGLGGEIVSASARLSFRAVTDAGVWPPSELD